MGLVSGLMLTLTTAARKGVRSKSRKKIEQPKKRESNLVLFCNLPELVEEARLVWYRLPIFHISRNLMENIYSTGFSFFHKAIGLTPNCHFRISADLQSYFCLLPLFGVALS